MATPDKIADRPQRADARRNHERILAAAVRLFAERGLEVQMDDVARAASVGVGTVYRHFPTKEALMGRLVARHFEGVIEVQQRALTAADPWEGFVAMISGGAALMAADAHMRQAVVRFPASAWQEATPERGRVEELGAQIIARAHAAGALRRDFTVADMPMLMGGICAGIDQPGAHAGRLVEILLAGLRA